MLEFGIVIGISRLVIVDDLNNSDTIKEVASLWCRGVLCSYQTTNNLEWLTKTRPDSRSEAAVSIADIQIDNQLYNEGAYDFPVLMVTTNPKQKQFRLSLKRFLETRISELKELEALSEPVFLVKARLSSDSTVTGAETVVQTLELNLAPISLNIEDTFIYDFIKITDSFMPTRLHSVKPKKSIRSLFATPPVVASQLSSIAHPLRLSSISVSQFNVLLSVHASLKIFLSSDDSPLNFASFSRQHLLTSGGQLTRSLAMHYASGALFRAGNFIVR